jgi:Peptidase A4 family
MAGSSVLAGFAVVAPAYAATPDHSAAAATAAGPRTPTGALVQPGGISHLIGPRTARTGARNTTTTSTNWSGYAATGGTYRSVSSSWTEPTGSCSPGDQYSSFWVGLDGYRSETVEQTGSEVDCAGRTPEYYSWYEMYPANPVNFSNAVKPGDRLTGSVTYTGGSSFTLKLSDTTEGWSHTVTKTLSGAARSSAEVIAEAPCCTGSGGNLPLADFGQVGFAAATVDGSPIGNFNPVGIAMVSASGVQEDSISSLSSGGNFSARWLSRPAAPRG